MPLRPAGRSTRLLLVIVLLAVTLPALSADAARAQKRPADFHWIGGEPRPPPELPDLLVGPGDLPDLPAGTLVLSAPLRSPEPGEPPLVDGACIARGVLCVRERLARLGLSGEETIVLEGDDPAAVGRLFWLLEWSGFSDVRVLDPATATAGETGPRRWRPVPPAPRPAASDLAVPVAPHSVVTVDRSWVRNRFGTPEVELVDLRGRDAWAAGHLPHSLPFDFEALLAAGDEAGPWPDAAAARRTLGRLGPRPNTYVDLAATMVVYSDGTDGRRLGLAYLLLRMMGVEAAVFPGGWAEWREDPASPVVRVADAAAVRDLLAAGNPELADRPVPGVTLLDVRGERDHFARHLPGALSFPSRRCPETDWSAVPPPPSGDRLDAPLVFYCYGENCIRSRDCSTAAARHGFRDVLWFRDGVPAWHEAGLPLYRSGKPGATATRLPGSNDS